MDASDRQRIYVNERKRQQLLRLLDRENSNSRKNKIELIKSRSQNSNDFSTKKKAKAISSSDDLVDFSSDNKKEIPKLNNRPQSRAKRRSLCLTQQKMDMEELNLKKLYESNRIMDIERKKEQKEHLLQQIDFNEQMKRDLKHQDKFLAESIQWDMQLANWMEKEKAVSAKLELKRLAEQRSKSIELSTSIMTLSNSLSRFSEKMLVIPPDVALQEIKKELPRIWESWIRNFGCALSDKQVAEQKQFYEKSMSDLCNAVKSQQKADHFEEEEKLKKKSDLVNIKLAQKNQIREKELRKLERMQENIQIGEKNNHEKDALDQKLKVAKLNQIKRDSRHKQNLLDQIKGNNAKKKANLVLFQRKKVENKVDYPWSINEQQELSSSSKVEIDQEEMKLHEKYKTVFKSHPRKVSQWYD